MMSSKKLISLLQQKRGYFEAILDLTELEPMLPIPDWISSLKQKQILLSCIDEVDEEITSYQQRFQHLSQDITEELDRIRNLVGHIMNLNSYNIKIRKKSLDECR